MSNNSKLAFSILAIIFVEIVVVAWFTISIDESLFFEKCARNSGRVSAGINLALLLFIGRYSLKNISHNTSKRFDFNILVTLYAINHIIHGYFIYKNFTYKSYDLDFIDPLHGFVTFILILLFPLFTWSVKKINKLSYAFIILHFFNTTYFLILTFYGRIKPDRPEYVHQAGIVIMILALLWILYGIVKRTRVPNEQALNGKSIDS